MGKKTTTSELSSLGVSKRAKLVVPTPSANVPPVRAQAACGHRPTRPHVTNKYELQFVDQEHITRYDSFATRRIIEPEYMDVDLLRSLRLWDGWLKFLEVAGWVEFVIR